MPDLHKSNETVPEGLLAAPPVPESKAENYREVLDNVRGNLDGPGCSVRAGLIHGCTSEASGKTDHFTRCIRS